MRAVGDRGWQKATAPDVSIEELYDWIEAAIEATAYQFDVAYDPALGYPTRINLDFDERVIDDEILVHVTGVTVLERRP